MPLIHCNFFSQVLGICTSMDVILPLLKFQEGASTCPEPHPTLYLLHGYSDDHTIWQRRTSIERYVEGLNLAVVMPNVHLSYYTNMAIGLNYWTFISQEVPHVARSLFHLSTAREDNFAAGLSMGGYGAFKLALARPGMFCAAASLSGALDVVSLVRLIPPERRAGMQAIFGDLDALKSSPNDLFTLAQSAAKNKDLMPRLFQYCGTEDFLYPSNTGFLKTLQKLKYNVTYTESPGDHQWKYWDEQIQRVLEWLPLKKL